MLHALAVIIREFTRKVQRRCRGQLGGQKEDGQPIICFEGRTAVSRVSREVTHVCTRDAGGRNACLPQNLPHVVVRI